MFCLVVFSQENTDDIAIAQREYVPVLLQIIHKNCAPSPENCEGGVYVGATGVAYAFYHVAESGLFDEKKDHFLNIAEKYIKVNLLSLTFHVVLYRSWMLFNLNQQFVDQGNRIHRHTY